MLNFVFGETAGTQTVVGATLGDILVLDLPGDPLDPQDWVFVVSGESRVYDGAATSADVRSDIRLILNATTLLTHQYLHQNNAGTFSKLGFCEVVWVLDHAGFLNAGVHQTYSTLKVQAAANTTDSAGAQIDLTNVRILGIRVPRQVVGTPLLYQNTATVAAAGTAQLAYGAKTWVPTRGRYLVASTLQTTLAAGTGTLDLKLLVTEPRDASTELGATTQEIKRIPGVDLSTGSAGLGHLTHQEDATRVQKIPITAIAVVDLWEVPTAVSWLVDYVGTAAGTQAEQVWTVALPLDGNWEYGFVEYPGCKTNATTTYSTPVKGLAFGRTAKLSYLLYQGFVTKTAAGDCDAQVFPTGTTTGAIATVAAQTIPLALETVYLQGSAKVSGVSTGFDLAFRETTATGGDALFNHGLFVALVDHGSGQSGVQGHLDLPIVYDVEAFEPQNPVDAATSQALQQVADSAEPLGTKIMPVVLATDTRTSVITGSDTLLNG